MRRQSVIALVVAVLLGLVAVFLANTYFTARENQIDNSDLNLTKVAVAALPLEFGAEITPERIKFVDLPQQNLPPGTFTTIEELLPEGETRFALRPIQLNQPLLASELTGVGEGASLAATLEPGMRAATVRVDAVSGVAGFIRPFDTVDVLVTRGQQTDILLQNVRVIAMDQDAQGEQEGPALSSTATMEVTPLEAQKLALGQQAGTLSLVLRKPGADEDATTLQTISIDDLRYEMMGVGYRARNNPNREASAEPVRRPRRTTPTRQTTAPAPPPRPQVEVTRGLQSSTYEVGEYDR